MSIMAAKIVTVNVSAEARAKVIRSVLNGGPVQAKLTAGQRRAVRSLDKERRRVD